MKYLPRSIERSISERRSFPFPYSVMNALVISIHLLKIHRMGVKEVLGGFRGRLVEREGGSFKSFFEGVLLGKNTIMGHKPKEGGNLRPYIFMLDLVLDCVFGKV